MRRPAAVALAVVPVAVAALTVALGAVASSPGAPAAAPRAEERAEQQGAVPQGAQLAAELGCAGCHSGLDVGARVRERAPDLSFAGLRWQTGYLLAYLREPRPVRRHVGASRMPDFRLDEREALALALFLAEQRHAPPGALEPSATATAVPASGRDALPAALARHDCLVCHTWEGRGGVRGPELSDLGARLEPGWVRRFLAAPAAFGVPDGVMPALLLRPENGEQRETVPGASRDLETIVEAAHALGAERRAAQDEALAAARARHPGIDARAGERVFRALGCAACHALAGFAPPSGDAPDLGNEGLRVRASWLRAYLASPVTVRPAGGAPGSASRMPDFRLTEAEVEALAAWLGERRRDAALLHAGVADAPLPPWAERKARTILRDEASCLGCHRLGDEGGRIGPDLTAAGLRLEPAFVEAMIRDPQRMAPHAVMPKAPLTGRDRELLARLIAHQSGQASTVAVLSPLEATLPDDAARGAGDEPGADAYARYCAPCHGPGGGGDGFNAPYLPTRPTAHADAAYVASRPDDTIWDGIAAGGAILGKSHLMPAWGETLPPATITALVRHVRDLCACEGPAWSLPSGRAAAAGAAQPGEGAPPPALPSSPVLPTSPALPAATLPAAEVAASGPSAAAPVSFPPPLPRRKAPASVFSDFVGAEACAPCHAEQYDAWAASTHGRAGGVPPAAEVIAPFDGEPIRFRDARVVPERDASGAPSFRVEQRGSEHARLDVAAVVGGGHMVGGGTQSFFARYPDGTLRFLPFDFAREQGVWFVQRRDDLSWTPVDARIALTELANWPPARVLGNAPHLSNCDMCHGSQIQVLPGRGGRVTTRFKSLAINCESCHGPGRRHVAWARAPDRDQRADLGLPPVDGLSKDASLQVCFQCHASRPVLDPDYLQGRSFDDHFALKYLLLEADPYFADGRIATFSYQDNHQFSDCYVSGSMTCVDCHDPHSQKYRDVFARPLEGRFADGQCTGCHASKAVDPERHTHHAPGTPGGACTDCHMPFLQEPTVGTKVRFARSDHTIPIPRPAFDASLPVENACSGCHAEKTVAELQADTEHLWGPIKPHPAAVRDYLAARDVTRQEAAAPLLLRPGERHVIGQFHALADFARRFVAAPGATLEPATVARLEALAASDDLDVRALALASLHFGAGDDPAVRTRLAAALSGLGDDDRAIRLRWASALRTLGRVRDARGGTAGRALARQRAREVLPQGVQSRGWRNFAPRR